MSQLHHSGAADIYPSICSQDAHAYTCISRVQLGKAVCTLLAEHNLKNCLSVAPQSLSELQDSIFSILIVACHMSVEVDFIYAGSASVFAFQVLVLVVC